jgi:antimicrobial peptide system SdpB family protein
MTINAYAARASADLLDRLWSRRRALRPVAAVRIGLGVAALAFYLSNYAERAYLLGPDGVWPWSVFEADLARTGAVSIYSFSRSPVFFELLYHLGMVVAVLFTLGWRTRVTTIAHWLFVWSLYQRNPTLLDGGDNLNHIVLVYMFFADSGARWSLDARRRARRKVPASDGSRTRLVTLLHNGAVVAIAVQVCVLYLAAGLYKVQGEMWTNGTALYYVMRTPEFMLPGVSEHLFTNRYAVAAMTYGSMLLLTFFPVLVLNRHTRLLAALAAMSFHLGTAVLMGLTGFAMVMVSVDMIFVSDRRLGQAVAAVARLAARVGRRVRSTVGRSPSPVPAISHRVAEGSQPQ